MQCVYTTMSRAPCEASGLIDDCVNHLWRLFYFSPLFKRFKYLLEFNARLLKDFPGAVSLAYKESEHQVNCAPFMSSVTSETLAFSHDFLKFFAARN